MFQNEQSRIVLAIFTCDIVQLLYFWAESIVRKKIFTFIEN